MMFQNYLNNMIMNCVAKSEKKPVYLLKITWLSISYLRTTWLEENLVNDICLILAGRLEVNVFPCMSSVSELKEYLKRFIC